jgi:hypothetical protein
MERIQVIWHRDDSPEPVELDFSFEGSADLVLADIIDVIARDAIEGSVGGLGEPILWFRPVGESVHEP